MSEMERNKGKLIPTGVDTEHFSDDDWDTYRENGFAVIDGEIYEVEWEFRRIDIDDFTDVKINEDGSIYFHTLHWDGRPFEEVIENALGEINYGN